MRSCNETLGLQSSHFLSIPRISRFFCSPFRTISAVFSICLRQTAASTLFLNTTTSDARSTRSRSRVVRRERSSTLFALSFAAPTTSAQEIHTNAK